MKVYTKTGDEGLTGLIGGKRVRKNDPRIETIGAVDELNSLVGVLRSGKIPARENRLLEKIQNDLFTVGSLLASPSRSECRWRPKENPKLPQLTSHDTEALEKAIDVMWKKLPELRHFILPGGSFSASMAYLARAVCRRAERNVVAIKSPLPQEVLRYLNRLSDYFFVLARHLNFVAKRPETIWKGVRRGVK